MSERALQEPSDPAVSDVIHDAKQGAKQSRILAELRDAEDEGLRRKTLDPMIEVEVGTVGAKAQVIDGIVVFGDADQRTMDQARRCATTAERTALMADNHLGYAQPIGGVTAYRNAVSLSGVGFDISCGNKAVLLDIPEAEARANIALFMDQIFDRVSFGVGRKNRVRVEDEVLDDALFDEPWLREIDPGRSYKTLRDMAAAQLGTVGCLSGETMIPTLGGEQRTIRDIVGRWESGITEEWVFSYDKAGHRIVPGRVVGAVRSGVQRCIRLTLDNGEVIVATPDHPFLTLQEKYVRADVLTPETSIMPLYARERHKRPEVYQPVLGYWDSVHRLVVIGTQLETFLAALISHAKRTRGTEFQTAIHHRDRNKWNNYPSNLEVMSINDHNRLHCNDARETLARMWADPAFREKQRAASSRSAKEHWSSETKRFAKIEGMKRSWAGNDARKAAFAENVGRRDKTGEKNPNYRHGRYAKNHRVVKVEEAGTVEVFDLKVAQHNNFALGAGVFVHNSGNHYVDVFVSERGQVWAGVHFGSRGLGHKITTHFLSLAGAKDGMDAEPCVLDLSTEIGQQYLAAMRLAGRYAYAGRDWVCQEVARILGAEILREVHNHHNFAWEEEHGGEQYVVVRKGATPAFPGQEGFVGGSMGDISVILEGVDSEDSRASLYSTVHGAGRAMSRTEAAGKVKRRKAWACGQRECSGTLPIQTPTKPDGSNPRCPECGSKMHKRQTEERVREGRVSREMMAKWVTSKGVELRGAGVDESPHCYKRIEDVLAAHEGTIRVTEVLHPIGVAMASAGEFDPYRD